MHKPMNLVRFSTAARNVSDQVAFLVSQAAGQQLGRAILYAQLSSMSLVPVGLVTQDALRDPGLWS